MARPKIGDIIEIKTKRGLAYAQFTHKHPLYGSLIRILPGFFDKRPVDLKRLAAGETRYVTFFPLGSAVSRGYVAIAGNAPVPEFAQAFPTFRSGTPDQKTLKVATWWLWDGEKEWRIGALTPEQRKLSLRGVWTYTYLIDKLESDWSPESDTW
jgi:hypothetical protein